MRRSYNQKREIFMFMRLIAVVALTTCMATSAFAAGSALDPPVLRARLGRLEAQVRSGTGAYRDADAALLSSLAKAQKRALEIAGNKNEVGEYSVEERTELVAVLEEIDRLVARAEDERIVCRKMRPIGTNRPQVICMTVAQRRQQREVAREALWDKKPACSTSHCNPSPDSLK